MGVRGWVVPLRGRLQRERRLRDERDVAMGRVQSKYNVGMLGEVGSTDKISELMNLPVGLGPTGTRPTKE